VRFYLDEDLPTRVAALARAQGLDVVSSHECGRDRMTDDQQLRLAGQEGRCLVTRNARDFVPLTRDFAERQWPHAGLLIVTRSLPNHAFASIARALVAFDRGRGEDLPAYAVLFLSADIDA
jgi:predicted nuclease of predicted toxin-antitoxin system